MQMVKIADLKNNLSRYLARVRRGAEITVYDRNTPVARLVPFVAGDARRGATKDTATQDRVADLVRQGVLSAGDTQALARWLDAHPPVARPAGTPTALDVLLEMRRASTR
jgi:prevent-host-death family protein